MWSKRLVLVSLGFALMGCETFKQEYPNDPAFAPILPIKTAKPVPASGSIYDRRTSLALFETLRARRVGDILTVLLVEKTDAQKKATTDQLKNDSIDIKNSTMLGKPIDLGNGRNFSFKLDADRQFNGKGESKQNNKLSGTISVTVTDVLDNGNMIVRGEKWIKLNQGKEYIRLAGIVRAADITPENTITSDRIANARIAYSGTGQVANTNVQGWLSQFFNTVFFPF